MYVGQHDMGQGGGHRAEMAYCRIAGVRCADHISGVIEQKRKHLAAQRIVIHNQNSQRPSFILHQGKEYQIERFNCQTLP
ncbi:hypothetical protein GCM10011585_22850 [Edaphobacter dinghuensis]|uniref:Uncharacterized protein n=1 Tax=Edaphobacter dinghuensis TaxID=1560005 RepID=A0A917HHH1_9BACT|nr:hypothetical protein GCM10011585_22850 [Edaphobacter dinghuensis]